MRIRYRKLVSSRSAMPSWPSASVRRQRALLKQMSLWRCGGACARGPAGARAQRRARTMASSSSPSDHTLSLHSFTCAHQRPPHYGPALRGCGFSERAKHGSIGRRVKSRKHNARPDRARASAGRSSLNVNVGPKLVGG